MAAFTLERVIVNKGIILLTEEQREVTRLALYCRIERQDPNASYNYKFQFARSFYGYVQAIFRGHVVGMWPIEWKDSRVYDHRNFYQEDLINQICIHQRTMNRVRAMSQNLAESIFNLPGWLTATGEPDEIVLPFLERLDVDYFAVKLFGRTTAVFKVFGGVQEDYCENPVTWEEPPGPARNEDNPLFPPVVPPVPINEDDPNGYDLPDPPYDPATDDSGLTYDPPREPEEPPPPPPVLLARYQMVVTLQPVNGEGNDTGEQYEQPLGFPFDDCVKNWELLDFVQSPTVGYANSFNFRFEFRDGTPYGPVNSGSFAAKVVNVRIVQVGTCTYP